MESLKRFVWVAAGLAAVSVILTLATEGHASAQAVRAALVRNQDEPGRNPYFEYVQNHAACISGCNITFSPVPAGQRLVVTFVNAQAFGSPAPSDGVMLLHRSNDTAGNLFVPTFTPNPNGFATFVHSPVEVYFEAGTQPILECVGANDIRGTLSGYYISLP